MDVPFNRVHKTGAEIDNIEEAIASNELAGSGPFTRRCEEWLEGTIGCKAALLTHSCTAALEMAALLLDIEPGDEVIMPSFTFVSTASAFVLRRGVPVFVDIDAATLNLDPGLVEAAIGPRTRAIVPVHYAGVACEMEALLGLADRHGLAVVEDAAQGISATYRGRPLGSLGQMAAVSFHETKNVISGEGGALLLNDARLVERAEIVLDKGTNRRRFLRGQVDKYTWVDVGSSFLPSDLIAAFLFAQMQQAEPIRLRRVASWYRYHDAFAPLEAEGLLRRPVVPPDRTINGHLYYLLLPTHERRDAVLGRLEAEGVEALFHYVPLHSSPAGRRFGRTPAPLPVTERTADTLVRLPMWVDMDTATVDAVVEAVTAAVSA